MNFWSKSNEKYIDCEDHYVFTGDLDKLIQSTPLQPIYVRSIFLFFQLRLDPPVGLFVSGSPTKTLHAFLCGVHCSCVNTRFQVQTGGLSFLTRFVPDKFVKLLLVPNQFGDYSEICTSCLVV